VAGVKDFEELRVWQRARQLSIAISRTASKVQLGKDYDLSRQMRRSVGSVMDNIAEGFGRGGNKEFIQFLYIARGSASELRSQLHPARDHGYVNLEIFDKLRDQTIEIESMLFSFIRYLKTTHVRGTKNR